MLPKSTLSYKKSTESTQHIAFMFSDNNLPWSPLLHQNVHLTCLVSCFESFAGRLLSRAFPPAFVFECRVLFHELGVAALELAASDTAKLSAKLLDSLFAESVTSIIGIRKAALLHSGQPLGEPAVGAAVVDGHFGQGRLLGVAEALRVAQLAAKI